MKNILPHDRTFQAQSGAGGDPYCRAIDRGTEYFSTDKTVETAKNILHIFSSQLA